MPGDARSASPGRWEAVGRLVGTDELPDGLETHAQMPTPLLLEEQRYRLYFASRDADQRSHVCWCDVDLAEDPVRTGPIRGPALAPGPLGGFDDHGVYPSSVVREDDRVLLYYVGWNPGKRSPLFYASAGLAVSDDAGRTFRRGGRAPVLARSEVDPLFVTAPVVRREGGRWRMWYVSGLEWFETRDGSLHSRYHIRHAGSPDGREWTADGTVCVELEEGETNIGRFWPVRVEEGWEGWYSRAAPDRPYTLGYATSTDGLDWDRRDDEVAGALPGSDVQAYPAVVRSGARRHLFYNGESFGREGILYARETA